MAIKSKPNWSEWLAKNKLSGLIEVPEEIGAQPWKPSEEDKQAAWVLYTEIRTRITTQPLHYRAGDEETALTSIYNLFEFSREAIKKHGPECHHFATLTISVLNQKIRPFTARWHKKKIDGRLQHDDERRQFRADLQQVQKKLKSFSKLLGLLAEGDAYVKFDDSIHPDTEKAFEFRGDIPFSEILLDDNVPGKQAIYQAELECIRKRRNANAESDVKNLVGLACSGGGIRSATFCLGVVQGLSKSGLLSSIDYLSTVSGGGYFGAFLSSFLNDNLDDVEKNTVNNSSHEQSAKDAKRSIGLLPDQLPFFQQGKPESDPIRHLRNNSKYLLKGGLLGQSRMLALFLYGISINLLTFVPIILMLAGIGKIPPEIGIDGQIIEGIVSFTLAVLWGLLGLAILVLPFIYKQWIDTPKRIKCYERSTIAVFMLLISAWVVAVLAPQLYAQTLSAFGSSTRVLMVFAACTLLFTGTAFIIGLNSFIGRLLVSVAGILGPLLVIIVFFIFYSEFPQGLLSGVLLILTALVIYGWLQLININRISPHRYYRNRLTETYLIRMRSEGKSHYLDPQKLSNLQGNNPAAPYHLINGAVNLPASKQDELRGRNADFFVFSRYFCGSPLVGYCDTKELESKDPSLDLGTAMAISGAAASSHMGKQTFKGLAFLMALFNIRLGYWLPNPYRVTELKDDSGPGPLCFYRELFGNMDEKGKYLNISDGGHIENLGIYELLRRQVKFIIAIDAEADTDMTFGSLIKLIRYAKIDFGINISELELEDLRKNELGYSKAHFSLAKINYANNQIGYLLYIKSSITGNEDDYILDYRRTHPSFPHESTADQFFDEAQFEAYRALGYHIGKDLFRDELISNPEELTIDSWFTDLANNLFEAPLPTAKK